MNYSIDSNVIYRDYTTDEQDKLFNNTLGSYSTEDFTIRLAYFIHNGIEKLTSDIMNGTALDENSLKAYSTYVHEIIHWRQHIGSTSGFILSLILPIQFLNTEKFLKIILKNIGPVKPLTKYYYNNVTTNHPTDELFINLNNVLNNYYDLYHYRNLVVNPKLIHKEQIQEEFYLSYGHSTAFTYINLLESISYFFDGINKDKIVSRIEELKQLIVNQQESKQEEFNAFKINNKVIPPLGLLQIYEGQARFLQLQFLYHSNKDIFTLQRFESENMFRGVYGEAFELYLKITGLDYPEEFGDSVINIFLVVCDLAINPTSAFPTELEHEDSFFFDVIPGLRFYNLCQQVKALNEKKVDMTVKEYSKEEYEKITSLLCEGLNYPKPSRFLNEIIEWKNNNKIIEELLNEEQNYSFKNELYQIRFLFSKFIIFCRDKLENPEFFCWTGACSSGKNLKDIYAELTEKHKAPFVNQKDLDIYASSNENVSEYMLNKFKDQFTSMNIILNLTRQWIEKDGEFDVNFFEEISAKNSESELYDAYSEIFNVHYNYRLDQFKFE